MVPTPTIMWIEDPYYERPTTVHPFYGDVRTAEAIAADVALEALVAGAEAPFLPLDGPDEGVTPLGGRVLLPDADGGAAGMGPPGNAGGRLGRANRDLHAAARRPRRRGPGRAGGGPGAVHAAARRPRRRRARRLVEADVGRRRRI